MKITIKTEKNATYIINSISHDIMNEATIECGNNDKFVIETSRYEIFEINNLHNIHEGELVINFKEKEVYLNNATVFSIHVLVDGGFTSRLFPDEDTTLNRRYTRGVTLNYSC